MTQATILSDAAFTTRPELTGTFGAVASTHWLATAVGMKILEAGGNAFDAAVATGFVLQIVEPHLNGPAGEVPILAARSGDTEPTVICGQGVAPAAATIDHFTSLGLDLIPGTGLLATCVPGAFGAWLTLLRDWGTISIRDALAPAIDYALRGHPFLRPATYALKSVEALFTTEWPSSASVYLPGGRAPEPGELFINPALAQVYSNVIHQAEDASSNREGQIEAALSYWYEGPIADAFGDFCQSSSFDVSGAQHRGLLVTQDLHGWRPPIERPLRGEFGGLEVFKCGAWSQGPAFLQALRILENENFGALDDLGPEFVHLVTEALKLAFADRDAWYGDSEDVPLATLLSAGYARERRALVGSVANAEVHPGKVAPDWPTLPKMRLASGAVTSGGGEPTFAFTRQERVVVEPDKTPIEGDTCHVDVVDRWGNMVSATPSGGWFQSSPVIPALGFPLNTRMQMFWLHRGHPNSLAPGKRPRTTLTPSMAFRGGKPHLAFGTPGGDQQEQWSLVLLLRYAAKGMGLQQAIDAPAFHTDHLIGSFWPRETTPNRLTVEDRFPEATILELRRRGHDVVEGGPWSEGRLSACAYEGSSGVPKISAAANPRGMQGYAIAR